MNNPEKLADNIYTRFHYMSSTMGTFEKRELLTLMEFRKTITRVRIFVINKAGREPTPYW
jgi:hypothetical protein